MVCPTYPYCKPSNPWFLKAEFVFSCRMYFGEVAISMQRQENVENVLLLLVFSSSDRVYLLWKNCAQFITRKYVFLLFLAKVSSFLIFSIISSDFICRFILSIFSIFSFFSWKDRIGSLGVFIQGIFPRSWAVFWVTSVLPMKLHFLDKTCFP